MSPVSTSRAWSTEPCWRWCPKTTLYLTFQTTPGIWLCCLGSLTHWRTRGTLSRSKNLRVGWYQSTGTLDMRIYWSWWVYLHLKTGGFIWNYAYSILYKITHGLCHFPTGIFTPRQISHNFRMNSFQLYQPFVRTNAFQFSFVPHTIYSLHPEHVAGSYSEFKLSNRPYCICSCSYSEFKLYNRP